MLTPTSGGCEDARPPQSSGLPPSDKGQEPGDIRWVGNTRWKWMGDRWVRTGQRVITTPQLGDQ